MITKCRVQVGRGQRGKDNHINENWTGVSNWDKAKRNHGGDVGQEGGREGRRRGEYLWGLV